MPVLLADVFANLFVHVADVVAISFCGRSCCH